jgi:hypothetical protein
VVFESWVPTPVLLELVLAHRRSHEIGNKNTEATARVIADLVVHSSSGRYEFAKRCIDADHVIDQELLLEFEKIILRRRVAV